VIDTKFLIITPEMQMIITEIDEFKVHWRHIRGLSPQWLRSLKRVASIESIASSNRIEGNKLTDREVEGLLSMLDRTSFKTRDEQEVAGYAKLMETVFENFEHIPLNENYIKQFHKNLLMFSEKDERHRGDYKKLPNSVAALDHDGNEIGIIFETAAPFDTPRLMAELVEWTRANLNDRYYHPLLVIALFVAAFLAIHPFQDGNGRLSRILTALLLLKAGYSYVPYSSMESIIEDNKEGYYRALRQTQTSMKKERHDYETWIMFFLRALQKQKIRLQNKVAGIMDESTLSLPAISAKIMDLFNAHQRLTFAEIHNLTQINRNSMKKHMKKLVDGGCLVKHGSTKGAWYTKPPA